MTERGVAPLDRESVQTALDELFALAGKYNSSEDYLELMPFVGRFRFYSPFNAMLIHTQMPGAQFACTARKWQRDYGREIKINARPIVILQPMGPVLFLFDVSDTALLPNGRPLPVGSKTHSGCVTARSMDNWRLPSTMRSAMACGCPNAPRVRKVRDPSNGPQPVSIWNL